MGAAAEVVAPRLLADEGAEGSASALRWKGLAAAQRAIGEIIGEADVKVDDGDRDVLLPPAAAATWRNVAALANVCGRRLVFLVTHMLGWCGFFSNSDLSNCGTESRTAEALQALCSIISHTDSSLFTTIDRCAVFGLSSQESFWPVR